MSMQPEMVMRTWFDQLWNRGQDSTIDQIMSADCVVHGLPGSPLRGPAGFRPVFTAFRGAFPDIHISVERTITDGVYVTTHCRVTGTHTGDGLGVPPTGRPVDFEGITIARIRGTQFDEGWNCFDFLGMYQQLGVIPPLPGA